MVLGTWILSSYGQDPGRLVQSSGHYAQRCRTTTAPSHRSAGQLRPFSRGWYEEPGVRDWEMGWGPVCPAVQRTQLPRSYCYDLFLEPPNPQKGAWTCLLQQGKILCKENTWKVASENAHLRKAKNLDQDQREQYFRFSKRMQKKPPKNLKFELEMIPVIRCLEIDVERIIELSNQCFPHRDVRVMLE